MKIKSSPSRKLFMAVDYVLLTVMSLVCVLPIINLLAMSFSSKVAVASNQVTFWPVEFNTAAYSFILTNAPFWAWP